MWIYFDGMQISDVYESIEINITICVGYFYKHSSYLDNIKTKILMDQETQTCGEWNFSYHKLSNLKLIITKVNLILYTNYIQSFKQNNKVVVEIQTSRFGLRGAP